MNASSNEIDQGSNSRSRKISAGAIAGIVIAVIVFIALIVLLVILLLKRRFNDKDKNASEQVSQEVDNDQMSQFEQSESNTYQNNPLFEGDNFAGHNITADPFLKDFEEGFS